MLYGPNTNNGSILTMIEAQVEHALAQIQRISNEGLAWIDVRPEPMERYNEEVQQAIGGVEVWQADCNGYYRTPSGRVVTADGKLHRIDTLIIATGFAANRYLSCIEVAGRGGQRIEDAWNDGARAYLGVTTAGFPNLFMLYGPNTNNGSILTMIESQVDYALRQIQRIASEGLAWLDVRRDPMERYNEEVQQAIGRIEVWQADCNGYYRSASGRIVTQWPHSMSEYRERSANADAAAFEVAPL